MTADDLESLVDPCVACTFWETGLVDLVAPAEHVDRVELKLDWAATVTRRWGHCGVIAFDDDAPIGHLTMAPARAVPRLQAFATTPVASDAAVVMSAHVVDELRLQGVGRQLVQFAAGLVARRDIRALEAVGTYYDGPSCMLPAGWLTSVGFHVVRPHPTTPRLRMDLQTTSRWRPGLEAAWSRLSGIVAGQPVPEPATFAPVSPTR